jgi:hypothetical protein
MYEGQRAMPDAKLPYDVEPLDHHGFEIRLARTELEWVATVAQPQQRPTLIVAADRDSVIAKAHEWIETHRGKDQGAE